jgi:hypothetical protein
MLLFHFTSWIKSSADFKLINDISKFFAGIMPVKYSAASTKIKTLVAHYIPSVDCLQDLFAMEYEAKRFVQYVIYIGSDPTEFLKACLEHISKVFLMLRPKDIWMIRTDKNPFDDFDLTCLASGATHKTLLAASKLKVYSDNKPVTDAKIKMLFLANRLEMRPMNIQIQ